VGFAKQIITAIVFNNISAMGAYYFSPVIKPGNTGIYIIIAVFVLCEAGDTNNY
jgi:hypothetical protein